MSETTTTRALPYLWVVLVAIAAASLVLVVVGTVIDDALGARTAFGALVVAWWGLILEANDLEAEK